MKQAVCVILIDNEGKILGVSRRNKPNDMNLPGGKVDPGETPEEACIRETKEEVGVDISDLELVYVGPCRGEVDYECFCYFAEHQGKPHALEQGLTVRWITWNELLDPSNSFADYNRRLFDSLRQYGRRN
jgi:8-oxo-dGTP diphosphatase